MAAPSAADDDHYEICNDDGFVYKRRRGLYPDVAPPSAQAAGPNPEAARRRCRRRALLRLRDKRLRELAHWEALEGKLQAQQSTSRPHPPLAPPASPHAADTSTFSVLDDLLVRAQVEEAILKKVAGLCDEVDALCRAHEEDVVDAITALPVWGDPKELLISLHSPDPGDMNFRKDYRNEGNGAFQRLDSRQDKRVIDAGSYNGCHEAAGVSPAEVQMIKESGQKKRGPYQHKICFQTGHSEKTCHETPAGQKYDDPSILSENRKKKGVATPSGSKSAKNPKRFYQSTSPNPGSSGPRPTTRAAAAKMRNQEASS